MSLVDKEGKPIQKKWHEMDMDERIDALRQGLGILMQSQEALHKKLDVLLKSVDQYEESINAKTEGGDGPTYDGNDSTTGPSEIIAGKD